MKSPAASEEIEGAENEKELLREFRAHENSVVLRNANATAIVAAVLMLAGSAMDYFVYPDRFGNFFLWRLFSAILDLLILVGILFVVKPRLAGFLVTMIPVPPIISITWMIYVTEGGSSPYYAGLILVLVTLVIALRWSMWKNLAMIVFILVVYTLTVALSPASTTVASLVNNYFFMVTTGVLVGVGSYLYEQVRKSEFRLRRQVESQNGILEENQKRLQELDETKTRFFSNISHELRTPLTVILGTIDSLREGNRSPDKTVNSRYDVLYTNGLRLLGLIDNLLDLVRFDDNKMDVILEPVDAKVFLPGLLASMAPLADRKNIHVNWSVDDELPVISLDKDKVEKIVLNLLINAVKFTDPGGTISLEAEYQEGHLYFLVKDTGLGMSEEKLNQVFSRFWQADTSSNRKFRGSGIGLSLVQSHVDLMQGKIEIDSAEGVGTTFKVSLPAPLAENQIVENDDDTSDPIASLHRQAMLSPSSFSDEQEVSLPRHLTPLAPIEHDSEFTILIADDETDLRKFLVSELSKNYQVIEACDGMEATALAKQYRPDVVLLDYMMPVRNGLDVCQDLRKDPGINQVPIIMLTARADEDIKLTCLRSGASDFLPKPFSLSELRLRVAGQIQLVSFKRELKDKNKELLNAMEQLKENEMTMLTQEKLSSLGIMSAGIVHEVNNPLNYVKSAIHLLSIYGDSIADDEKEDFKDTLKDVEEGISRVISIITDLKSLTTKEAGTSADVEISHLVSTVKKLSAGKLSGRIDFARDFPEGLIVHGREIQIVQVFVNLIENACDAIQTRRKEEPDLEGRILFSAKQTSSSGQVTVTIADNGCGIDPGDEAKIFDPFFTRKAVGEGMGVGLSIVHQILVRSKIRFEVNSIVNEGTTFTLIFPEPSFASSSSKHPDTLIASTT